MNIVLTPALILEAYRHGLFPMGAGDGSPIVQWVRPPQRAQLSIPHLHIPRRLKKTLRRHAYDIRIDSDFAGVMRGCAAAAPQRESSWINAPIMDAFLALHKQGYAHSVEYFNDGLLAGGVYGLALGSAFFAESMFFKTRDASKIALVHLAARLWKGGFTLLDVQFVNPHLEQFGVYEIAGDQYQALLDHALQKQADFQLAGLSAQQILENYPPYCKKQ